MIRLLSVVRSGLIAAPFLLAACAGTNDGRPAATASASVEMLPPDPVPVDWQNVITQADRKRLETLDSAWAEALAEARTQGFEKDVAAEGELLDPAAALPRAAPPPGPYLCRVVKLGKQGEGRAFNAYKAFQCYVEAEGDLLTIVKQTGSQRPAGRLWNKDDSRLVFLGAMELGEEDVPPAYAADAQRDLAGYVERVAPFRWRLVVPWPQRESKLDVLELVPFPTELPPSA